MLKYLISNRNKKKLFSLMFFKTWLKRFYTLPSLVLFLLNMRRIKSLDIKVGSKSLISKCIINGKGSFLTIGNNSFIGKVTFHLHDFINIGNNVVINDKVEFFTASHDINDLNWKTITSPIIVEDYVWIASNSIILPGTHLKKYSVVGAGSVVRGKFIENSVIIGNPAKTVKYRDKNAYEYYPVDNLAAIKAWLKG